MMRRVYVISDLHGYYDLFIKLLDKISFNEYAIIYWGIFVIVDQIV